MHFRKTLTLTSILFFSMFPIIVSSANIASDDQIAKILTTSNDNEIAMAKLAKQNSSNKNITKFADHMIKEHSRNNMKSMRLASALSLIPVENERSMELKKEGEEKFAKLKDLKGYDFDRVYIEMQISEHEKNIDDLDKNLIPSAKNSKLKKLLQKTRTKTVWHLKHARKVQAKL